MLGRRGVLAGALGIVAVSPLSACDVDDLRPPESDETPGSGAPPSSGQTAAPDPDSVLLDGVATEIIGAATAVKWARRLPRLRRTLGPIERTHLAHLAVLEKEYDGPAPQRPASYAVALREVRSAEESLHTALVTAAVQAQSGALARLLASMSASVGQHLETLP